MKNTKNIINESITETQQVQFIIDKSRSLEKLKDVDISQFQKAIIFCDSKIKSNWWIRIEEILQKKIDISKVFFLKQVRKQKCKKLYQIGF